MNRTEYIQQELDHKERVLEILKRYTNERSESLRDLFVRQVNKITNEIKALQKALEKGETHAKNNTQSSVAVRSSGERGSRRATRSKR